MDSHPFGLFRSIEVGTNQRSTPNMSPFVILSLLLVPFHSAAAQQISTACDMQCSYKEDFQQANCEERQLKSIPIECSQSTYLSLRYNQIAEIEPGIFRDFLHLERLILSHNDIYQINANAFNGAYQLKFIKLLYNNLHIFNRDALNGTENLRSIHLKGNYLSIIEEGTFQLALKLERIDLSWNHLSYLSRTVFQDLKNLKVLLLGNNKLLYLPEDIFKDQSSLIYVYLSNNLLSRLPFDLFRNLVQLDTLDLDANRLVAITFTLPNIHVLRLSNNELKHLGSALLETWTSGAERLYLEGNPWSCNCSFEPFRSGCLQVSPYCNIRDTPVCASPPNLINRPLKNLNQTCSLQNNVLTTEVTKKESPHVYETTGGRNDHISEHPHYFFTILLLLLGPVCLLVLVRMLKYRGGRNGQIIQHSDSNLLTVKSPSTKRPCDMTPSKRSSQNSQNPPAPPNKNIHDSGDGHEIGRNGCRRNLGDAFV